MKKILLITILSFVSLFGISQVTNNFESGNWLYYANRCWGIGPNSDYFETKVTSNSGAFGNPKSSVMETTNLGNTEHAILESPWTNLISGDITFKHVIDNLDDGDIELKLYVVDENDDETLLYEYEYDEDDDVIYATINNTITGVHKIRWEWDSDEEGNPRGYLDNIVIPGTNVSDPSNNCNVYNPPPPPVEDSIVNYYPAADTSTLAFEDIWTSYGDYDMNDLVVGYKFKVVSDYDNHIVQNLYMTFTIRANGAGQHNGFGFQLPVTPGEVISVNGVGEQDGYIISSNGTETGNSDNATIIVWDDTHTYLPCWNTRPGIYCGNYTFNLIIKLDNVTYDQLDVENWNPFMISGGERGREIHLPDYIPTMLADESYFGTGDDDTQLGIKYYKSATNLPWVIDIYGKFDYPIESSDISGVYLHFGEWAESGGIDYMDWWLNTNPGYRNESLIY